MAEENDIQPPTHPDTYKSSELMRDEENKRELKQSNLIIKSMLDSVTAILSAQSSHAHLLHAQYGTNVDIRGYWKRCGFKRAKARGGLYPDPDTIRFQFEDIAAYQIKCEHPLQPMYKLESAECTKPQVAKCVFNPTVMKLFAEHILPMQVPGHWYGDSREFNYLTVLNTSRPEQYMRSKFAENGYNDIFEVVKSQAVKAAHAELTAQAYYLGLKLDLFLVISFDHS